MLHLHLHLYLHLHLHLHLHLQFEDFLNEEEAKAMIDRCRNFGKFERSQVLHRATPP